MKTGEETGGEMSPPFSLFREESSVVNNQCCHGFLKMGFRFQKRIKVLPGVSLNIGKRGASVSIGPRGARTTVGRHGIKHSFGIPGTGIRYETPYRNAGGGQRNSPRPPQAPEPPRVSFWERFRDMLGF